METLYLLIPMSVALVFVIALLFWWSLRNGQYDDLEGPGYRILMDDDRPEVLPDDAQPKVQSEIKCTAPGKNSLSAAAPVDDVSRKE